MFDRKLIPVIGLFRSGTNYLRFLLERNYEARVDYNVWGWKHGLMPSLARGSSFQVPRVAPLVIVKNPLSQVASLFSYSRHGRNIRTSAEDFSAFQKTGISYFCEIDGDIGPEYKFSNPWQMINTVVWNHLTFARALNGMTVRYEDLLIDAQGTCHQLAEFFQLTLAPHVLNEGFDIPGRVLRKMNDDPSRLVLGEYLLELVFDKHNYYVDGEACKLFSDSDVKFAMSELDPVLLKSLGYSVGPV